MYGKFGSGRLMTMRCCARESGALQITAEPDMKLVAEASNGQEAIAEFKRHRPDITLMDLQMPDMGGIECIIAIRS